MSFFQEFTIYCPHIEINKVIRCDHFQALWKLCWVVYLNQYSGLKITRFADGVSPAGMKTDAFVCKSNRGRKDRKQEKTGVCYGWAVSRGIISDMIILLHVTRDRFRETLPKIWTWDLVRDQNQSMPAHRSIWDSESRILERYIFVCACLGVNVFKFYNHLKSGILHVKDEIKVLR